MSSYDALTEQLHKSGPATNETDEIAPEGVDGVQEPSEPSPGEVLARRTLIGNVKEYLTTFPRKLEEFSNPERYPLEDMSAEEIKLMIDEMRLSLGMRNSMDLYVGAGIKAVALGEHIAVKYTPLKLQGLTGFLASNDEWCDCLKEIALETGGLQFLSPTKRFALITGMSVLQVHQLNNIAPAVPKNSTVGKELEAKFSEL